MTENFSFAAKSREALGQGSNEILMLDSAWLNHPSLERQNTHSFRNGSEQNQLRDKFLPSLQIDREVSELRFELECFKAAQEMLLNKRITEDSTAFLAKQFQKGGGELLNEAVRQINQNLIEMTKFAPKQEQLRLIYSHEKNRQEGTSQYRVILKNQLNDYFDQKIFR